MTLAIPTIHMNGTPKTRLVEAWCDAVHALHEAGTALAQTCPNGRDYYTQGPAAFELAQDQHAARMAKLKEIIKELEQMAQAVTFRD